MTPNPHPDAQPPAPRPPDRQSTAFAKTPCNLDPATYARLKAEVNAPYRGFRKFIYVSLAGSGFIGGVVFFAQIIAGRHLETVLPNFALQAGVVALMAWLFRLENQNEAKNAAKNVAQNATQNSIPDRQD